MPVGSASVLVHKDTGVEKNNGSAASDSASAAWQRIVRSRAKNQPVHNEQVSVLPALAALTLISRDFRNETFRLCYGNNLFISSEEVFMPPSPEAFEAQRSSGLRYLHQVTVWHRSKFTYIHKAKPKRGHEAEKVSGSCMIRFKAEFTGCKMVISELRKSGVIDKEKKSAESRRLPCCCFLKELCAQATKGEATKGYGLVDLAFDYAKQVDGAERYVGGSCRDCRGVRLEKHGYEPPQQGKQSKREEAPSK